MCGTEAVQGYNDISFLQDSFRVDWVRSSPFVLVISFQSRNGFNHPGT